MDHGVTIQKIQRRMDAVTKRWWLYVLLGVLFFLRPHAALDYAPGDSMDVIMQALKDPLIFSIPILMPIAKAIPILLIIGVVWLGNKTRKVFSGYVALFYLVAACFQQSGITEDFGLVVVTSNLVLILVVALLWGWEVISGQNNFEPRQTPWWKWWVAPFAVFAFLSPVDSTTLAPDLNPLRLLTNEAGLTYCMMTPFVLAVMTLFHPTVNNAVLRISSFVGILFGLVNMLVWFILMPIGWWMGVLHIPLLMISVYAFVLALRGSKEG